MQNRFIHFFLAMFIGCTVFGLAAVFEDAAHKEALKDHKKECARCHGKEGKGDGPTSRMLKVKPANWTDPDRMSKLSDEQLFLIIEKGGEAAGKSKLMPAFKAKLSEEQIARMVVFVK